MPFDGCVVISVDCSGKAVGTTDVCASASIRDQVTGSSINADALCDWSFTRAFAPVFPHSGMFALVQVLVRAYLHALKARYNLETFADFCDLPNT